MIPPKGYVLDVGANIGLISIPVALLVKTDSSPRVVAIEAVPDNCAALRKNVALNELEHDVAVFESPVGDIEKDVDIQTGSAKARRKKNRLKSASPSSSSVSLLHGGAPHA